MNYRRKKGQSLVETGLTLCLVSVVAVGSLSILGKEIKNAFNTTTAVVKEAREYAEISTGGQGDDDETCGDQCQCENAGGTWVEGWDPPCIY